MKKIDLTGTWNFCLDQKKEGMDKKYYSTTMTFDDTINLPATVSTAKKSIPSDVIHTGYLTDPYYFEGYTWYSKDIELTDVKGKEYFLVLERTRISHVWVDDNYVGSYNSLTTSHRYQLTPYIEKIHKLTIMVDNTSYPVPGGHMTSMDTQTNWNGITGELYIEERNAIYLSEVKIYPSAEKRLIEVKLTLKDSNHSLGTIESQNADSIDGVRGKIYSVFASVSGDGGKKGVFKSEYVLQEGENSFVYYLDDSIKTWSEHDPNLYDLHLELVSNNADMESEYDILEEQDIAFGLRDFKAVGNYFEINGSRTFLRGKHDGLIFPMTGHAPTDVESWLKVLGTAKEYGINHYRYHTSCPPKAAFIAADILGIYMEPELPFWGTVTGEEDENHDEDAQQYLIEEGYRILDEFGNHPSFVMMSLGNELWGRQDRLNEILFGYRNYDTRHLYTQGSNNFQFMPCILDNEDFFCGVRFSRERLFRGSYAMCDAPQGHLQTMDPNSNYNYDPMIRPNTVLENETTGGEVTIQYGTGTKTVKMDPSKELIPNIPVVSHEVGQYAMYPDFTEIDKYTGVLKARNFEEFKKRLIEKNLISMADQFFKASGRFAAECYKAEIETALRSNEMAGFQILDLQDFTGQGTALVGILNSFMENKGLISADEWQQFCADTVLLAELPKYTYKSGASVNIGIKLATYQPETIVNPKVELTILDGTEVIITTEKTTPGQYRNGLYNLEEFTIKIPETHTPKKMIVQVKIAQSDITNRYSIWVYPELKIEEYGEDIVITNRIVEALKGLEQGKKVIFYPENLNDINSIEGTYCTDFWCYPMFRSISESMRKPVPVGTLGLLINKEHSVFHHFPTEYYTTAQWYDIVSNSRALVLDDYEIEPLVWSIDNFERNHKLGNIFEVKVGLGKLLVCTCNLDKIKDSYPARWLEYSILKYISSEEFVPNIEIGMDELKRIFDKE